MTTISKIHLLFCYSYSRYLLMHVMNTKNRFFDNGINKILSCRVLFVKKYPLIAPTSYIVNHHHIFLRKVKHITEKLISLLIFRNNLHLRKLSTFLVLRLGTCTQTILQKRMSQSQPQLVEIEILLNSYTLKVIHMYVIYNLNFTCMMHHTYNIIWHLQ